MEDEETRTGILKNKTTTDGEVDYKSKSDTALSHSYLNQNPSLRQLRNVKCLRCGIHGHQSGDLECPLIKDAFMNYDPLTAILVHTNPSQSINERGTDRDTTTKDPSETVLQTRTVDDKSGENFDFTNELSKQGHLGYWRRRCDLCPESTPVEIDAQAYFDGVYNTLRDTLMRRFTLKTPLLPLLTVPNPVDQTAHVLACGVCVMTYLKVQKLVISDLPRRHNSISLKRPRIVDEFFVPTGFAYAIQQLGRVNAADTPKEQIFVPCFPNYGHAFGIPDSLQKVWNPVAYDSAVKYAKSLGLRFRAVDLERKNGTAWWLFRQTYEDGMFQLQCPLPEVNFTEAMAVTHTLFLNGNCDNPMRKFVNLAPLGDDNYGSFLRNPHRRIHVNSYEAII